ncbi:MAG: TniQ family protein [Chloroflexi bacterium]|nr:TniQ family protein [Chloroflexota bacterium]
MVTDAPVVYLTWDLARPTIPPRSRLFHLEPLGIGTPDTESLTGYVARLAEAHGVATRQLVIHEILPLLGRPHLATTLDPNLLSAFWRNETRALNGTQTLAANLVRVLEHLTGRRDLRFLTLLPWAEVLPAYHLQRPSHAWCSACYETRRQAGQPVGEPLLWTLQPVTACPRHRRRLRTICAHPGCGRPSPPLGSRSRPGHCARCRRWLGGAQDVDLASDEALAHNALQAQTWIVHAVGELIAAAPRLATPPRREQITRTLAASVEQVTGGNRSAWARRLGLTTGAPDNWHPGTMRPSLERLLQVCCALGTTPLRFFLGDPGSADPPHDGLRIVPEGPPNPWRLRPPLHRLTMQRDLEAVLASDEQPPPSLREVAQRLGDTALYLRHHLPDLCRAISERHLSYQRARGSETRARVRDEVHRATYRVHAEGRYPSARRVSLLLSDPVSIRSKPARAAWHEALRELGWQP